MVANPERLGWPQRGLIPKTTSLSTGVPATAPRASPAELGAGVVAPVDRPSLTSGRTCSRKKRRQTGRPPCSGPCRPSSRQSLVSWKQECLAIGGVLCEKPAATPGCRSAGCATYSERSVSARCRGIRHGAASVRCSRGRRRQLRGMGLTDLEPVGIEVHCLGVVCDEVKFKATHVTRPLGTSPGTQAREPERQKFKGPRRRSCCPGSGHSFRRDVRRLATFQANSRSPPLDRGESWMASRLTTHSIAS